MGSEFTLQPVLTLYYKNTLKRELRTTSKYKRELRTTSKYKRELRTTSKYKDEIRHRLTRGPA